MAKKPASKKQQATDKSWKIARTEANKLKRITKHRKKHPKDKTVAGAKPDYKTKPVDHHAKNKPFMMWDIDGYLDKKTGVIKVPNIMYVVLADTLQVVEFTHLLTEAEEAFRKLKCRGKLIKVTNNCQSVEVLQWKNPVPVLSHKEKMVQAFGIQQSR